MMNPAGHWFWWALTAACLIWYCTITVYVAIRGAFDIREMLSELGKRGSDQQH